MSHRRQFNKWHFPVALVGSVINKINTFRAKASHDMRRDCAGASRNAVVVSLASSKLHTETGRCFGDPFASVFFEATHDEEVKQFTIWDR